MSEFPAGAEGVAWFTALPDTPTAQPLAAALRGRAGREIRHASGRPWLLGTWPAREETLARAGGTIAVLLGQHAVPQAQLVALARRVQAGGDVDTGARSFAGSTHLAVSVEGVQRVQGSVLHTRRLFRARAGGVDVLADRADVLAWLAGTGIDEDRLSLHLLSPMPPHPLRGAPVWQGVEAVPGGSCARVTVAGVARTARWWTPPEPVLPLAEGAGPLREAMIAAVAARSPGDGGVSTSDLAGLDSTSLCCIVAREAHEVVTSTMENADSADDDVLWARRTADALGNVTHEVIPVADQAMRYAGLHERIERFDEPALFVPDRARVSGVFRWAARHRSARHFSGFGGDELFTGSPAWVSSYLYADLRLALRNVRGYRANGRWGHARTARQVLSVRPYRRWLAAAARRIGEPFGDDEPVLDWGLRPTAVPWVTPEAVSTQRALLRTAASVAEPLAPVRGQHSDLDLMQGGSQAVRQLGQVAAEAGVTLCAPYYDDRVIESGLAIRPQDRVSPWRYKPVVEQAMRGIVPRESLRRQTKGDGSTSHAVGLRRHRDELLEYLADSRLAARGMVDRTAILNDFRHTPGGISDFAQHLYPVLACEAWLRSLEAP